MRGLGPFLRDAWRLALPYFRSEERWAARGLLAAIVALNLSLVGMNVIFSFWNRAFYNTLQDKDWDGFVSLLFLGRITNDSILPGFCPVAALFVVTAVYRTYLNQWLRIRWRRWMTERFMGEWLSGQAYWRIALAGSTEPSVTTDVNGRSAAVTDANGPSAAVTDNPDQRIAEDLDSFAAETLSLGLGLLSAVVSLFSFVAILWGLSGPLTVLGVNIPGYMVWVALLYAALGTAVTHYVGRPLAALNFRQQRVEADFRFGLVRLRENMEGIALLGGEATERAGLSGRFSAVIANWYQIMSRTKMLTSVTAGYNQISVVFPLVVAAPRYFAGQIPLGALTQTSSAFGHVESSLSFFVNAYASLAGWRATVERLAGFERAIAAAHAAPGGVRVVAGRDYAMSDVAIGLPDGTTLIEVPDLALEAGRSVAISGASGLGKSTLFRTLAGIWPYAKGTVSVPAETHLFLPQRPYLPLGTLRRAVSYPAGAAVHEEAEVVAALEDVGLGHLAGVLDAEDNWARRLSAGEQQRLALARALLARPAWLFLDEATASLDPAAERELFAMLRRRLPGTTLVSITHRPEVAALHQRGLALRRGAGGAAVLAEAVAAD